MSENKNIPAFPAHFEYSAKLGGEAIQEPGLSKREYFAAAALKGLIANSTLFQGYSTHEEMARQAVSMADALIAELSKS